MTHTATKKELLLGEQTLFLQQSITNKKKIQRFLQTEHYMALVYLEALSPTHLISAVIPSFEKQQWSPIEILEQMAY